MKFVKYFSLFLFLSFSSWYAYKSIEEYFYVIPLNEVPQDIVNTTHLYTEADSVLFVEKSLFFPYYKVNLENQKVLIIDKDGLLRGITGKYATIVSKTSLYYFPVKIINYIDSSDSLDKVTYIFKRKDSYRVGFLHEYMYELVFDEEGNFVEKTINPFYFINKMLFKLFID